MAQQPKTSVQIAEFNARPIPKCALHSCDQVVMVRSQKITNGTTLRYGKWCEPHYYCYRHEGLWVDEDDDWDD